jgi:uncharacterized protein
MKLQPGMNVVIHSYKHNKKVHRIWKKSTIIEVDKNYVVSGNERTRVIEQDGRMWQTKEPAICIFFEDIWFNVIAMIKKEGIHYYCNLASPFVYDEEALKYIDYDLDVKKYPDQTIQVLDEDEFEAHKIIMDYSVEIINIIQDHFQLLMNKIKQQEFPFQDDVIMNYYELFKQLK